MTDLQLPSQGLTLLHDVPNVKDAVTKQFIQLNLAENITKDLLRSIRNNEQVHLKTGKKATVQYGKRSISLTTATDSFPSEVFAGPLDGSVPLYFSGKLSHILEVQKAREDTAKSNEALASLKNTLKSLQQERASNEASLVGEKDAMKPFKKDLKSSVLTNKDRFFGSTPSSPYLSAGRSPALGPTSAPLLSPAANKEKIRLEAMRIPIMHILAVRPITTDAMARLLNVSKSECGRASDKVSGENAVGKRELKPKSFKELDVWKFPYKSQEDRQLAIDNAIHAYDRMRVEKHDALWQLLLPKEERGKGKILSRLNFDKPLAAPRPATAAADKDGKSDISDRETKVKKLKPSTVKDSVPTKKKLNEDRIDKAKSNKAPARPVQRSTKQDTKFKSSERIEDSDEEADAVPVLAPNAKSTVPRMKDRGIEKSVTKVTKPSIPAPKASLHKSKLSDTSSTGSDREKSRTTIEKPKMKSNQRDEVPTPRPSQRPGKESSPQKPSPLGSSPPANSTDLETSSKASTRSSAPSSPPSSTDMPLANSRRIYSPIVAGKAKRKIEPSDEQPPAKKRQVNGDSLSSLPRGLTSQLEHSTPQRRPSGSSLSSPEKPEINQKKVVEAARAFTAYYDRYRKLHDKLSSQPLKSRDDGDIDNLWKMHKRLEEMKSDIWSDWERIGGRD